MINAYDEIAYPPAAFRQTHPDRLAADALLFGLSPAPVDGSRVLEIGAGDGSNLIPMALTYPGSRFVGFDLAAGPIAGGVETISALDLDNIQLFQGDITNIDLGPEPFDYIISHGVYSWVTAEVRQALMALVDRSLAAQGVAFVSYNSLPGGFIRLAIRDELLRGVRAVAGRTAKVEAAMRRVKSWPAPSRHLGAFQRAVAEEVGQMRERSFAALAHDELSDAYHPVYLDDFANHCAANGLQILVESDPKQVGSWFAAPNTTGPNTAADVNAEIIARAQREDFVSVRFFRQSLIVRGEAHVQRRPLTAPLRAMHVSMRARRGPDGRFSSEGGARFEAPNAAWAQVLEHLVGSWPATTPVANFELDEAGLTTLARLYCLDAVELVAAPSRFITTAGDRPAASPLARLQASRGDARLTTLRHAMTDVENDFTRRFVAALDGTRTRAEIARDIAPHFNLAPDAAANRLAVLLDVLAHTPLLVQ
jgi:hypothetical protein